MNACKCVCVCVSVCACVWDPRKKHVKLKRGLLYSSIPTWTKYYGKLLCKFFRVKEGGEEVLDDLIIGAAVTNETFSTEPWFMASIYSHKPNRKWNGPVVGGSSGFSLILQLSPSSFITATCSKWIETARWRRIGMSERSRNSFIRNTHTHT